MKNKFVIATSPWTAIDKIYKRHGKAIIIKTWPCFFVTWKYELETNEGET